MTTAGPALERAFDSNAHSPPSLMATRLTILDASMRPLLDSQGFRRYEDFVDATRGEVVGRSSTSQTRRIELGGASGGESGVSGTPRREVLFLKVYRYAGKTRRLGLWPDKGTVETRNYRILRQCCGIDVPDVIAHGSRRSRGYLLDAFILTRAIPHARPLEEFLQPRQDQGRVGSNHPEDAAAVERDSLRSYLLCQTAEMVARMHSAGFYHIDLQWRNILVSDDHSRRPRIFVIDSARGSRRHWKVFRAHGRLRDLSSLYKKARMRLTAREQIGWLRRYLGVRRLGREHHAMIRTILDDRRIKDRQD